MDSIGRYHLMKERFFLVIMSVAVLRAGELQDAARAGDIEKVRQLLANGVDINLTGEHRRTALHEAVIAGSAPLVELLLSKGANRNAFDSDLRSPLGHAYAIKDKAVRAQ